MVRSRTHPVAAVPPAVGPPALPGRDRLVEAFGELCAEASGALSAVFTGDDVESLHVLRMAIRRVAALRRLIPRDQRPPALRRTRRQIERFARLGGPRRNLDLLVEWLGRPGVHRAVGAATAKRLAHEFGSRRNEAQQQLCVALQSTASREWLVALAASLAPSRSFPEHRLASDAEIASAIVRMWRKVHRRAAAVGRGTGFRRLHRLRKGIRVLRYMLEFAAEDFPDVAVRKVIADLRRAQQALGRVCDLRARQRLLARAAADGLHGEPRDAALHLSRRLRGSERRARNDCLQPIARFVRHSPPRSMKSWQTLATAGGSCGTPVDD